MFYPEYAEVKSNKWLIGVVCVVKKGTWDVRCAYAKMITVVLVDSRSRNLGIVIVYTWYTR